MNSLRSDRMRHSTQLGAIIVVVSSVRSSARSRCWDSVDLHCATHLLSLCNHRDTLPKRLFGCVRVCFSVFACSLCRGCIRWGVYLRLYERFVTNVGSHCHVELSGGTR